MDEAKKKGISIDLKKFSNVLGVPVVGTVARNKKSLDNLIETIYNVCTGKILCEPKIIDNKVVNNIEKNTEFNQYLAIEFLNKAKEINNLVCSYTKDDYNKKTRTIDKIVTSKTFGIPIMLIFLGVIFWLTIVGANYPSELLSNFFSYIQNKLYILFENINAPSLLTSLLIDGVYRTLTWVISVMLPPMAIFFPLFTLLEDLGYLPRIAFNLDKCFKKCCASRKASTYNVYGFWLQCCWHYWM